MRSNEGDVFLPETMPRAPVTVEMIYIPEDLIFALHTGQNQDYQMPKPIFLPKGCLYNPTDGGDTQPGDVLCSRGRMVGTNFCDSIAS